ncbi:hypothetical protein Ais01nite_03050 [Asanoa ishikariensis]|uniref:Integral membrane protein n=2 Tax=Asanoa ishikariensis TaxID=137265 RepID=A0A1H3TKF8_9ACTN|nr:hypothetical protein [Asanoa ishikariensis]GIF62270.1 hypothetical protein Ais01nite_03050 [Asanoa ishikariensis]SDZ50590.1 hypothetical protein SAMN05421684_5926 [Asanoa ishikariensis]
MAVVIAPRVRARLSADVVVLGLEGALVGLAIVVGALRNHRGVGLHADAAPLFATWGPHVGWGTPAAVLVAAVVIGWGVPWARRAPWSAVLAVGWVAAVCWTLSLSMVDGWSAGLAERLTAQAEYLTEVPRVTDVGALLAGFADRILDFQPGSWSTHTAGHPPGALLLFVLLDRVGLGGGTAAGLACVLIGATVAVSVPVTLRALGSPDAARTAVPFLVLLPGAVWIGASADGIFAAVVAAGVALLVSRRLAVAAAGGLLLGLALYLSYGFVLVGLLALAAVASRAARRGAVLLAAFGGVSVVVAVFTLAGFAWWEGYQLVVQRYYQGWAAERPYAYWVWANIAALVLSAGPVAGPALCRALAALRLRRLPPPTVLFPVAAALAIAVADLSGMSKAEVERIWLPFAVWLLPAVALLPPHTRRWWLMGQALTALAVNHLLWTVS